MATLAGLLKTRGVKANVCVLSHLANAEIF